MGCGLFHDETSVFRQILQLQLVLYCTGAHFTLFFHQNQIRWKNYLVVILFLVIGSLHIFTHAMTAQLSCEQQKFATITISEFSKITLPSGLNYDGNSLVKEARGLPSFTHFLLEVKHGCGHHNLLVGNQYHYHQGISSKAYLNLPHQQLTLEW